MGPHPRDFVDNGLVIFPETAVLRQDIQLGKQFYSKGDRVAIHGVSLNDGGMPFHRHGDQIFLLTPERAKVVDWLVHVSNSDTDLIMGWPVGDYKVHPGDTWTLGRDVFVVTSGMRLCRLTGEAESSPSFFTMNYGAPNAIRLGDVIDDTLHPIEAGEILLTAATVDHPECFIRIFPNGTVELGKDFDSESIRFMIFDLVRKMGGV